MIKDDILELLDSTDDYLSGEYIANTLGVSRAAVWKAVRALSLDGYNIMAKSRLGYMLSKDNDILEINKIKKYIRNDVFDIELLDTVSSTNSLLKQKALEDLSENSVIIARCQTSGRGRLGRSFYSPRDTGIYMSILIKPDIEPKDALKITTATAVAICRALSRFSDKDIKIKWVNDIYIDGKKVCGILTEASSDCERGKIEYAVVGIGLNVFSPQDDFPDELKGIASGIFNMGEHRDIKNRLVAAILDEFHRVICNLNDKSIIEEYRSASFLIGRKVKLVSENCGMDALVIDIDDDLSLRVEYPSGEKKNLTSGEVRLEV